MGLTHAMHSSPSITFSLLPRSGERFLLVSFPPFPLSLSKFRPAQTVLATSGSLHWKHIFILIHSGPTARLISKSSWVYTHLFKSLWYSFNSPIKSNLHLTTNYVAPLWRLHLFLICLSPNQMGPLFPVQGTSFHLYPDPTSSHPASKPYISRTSTCSSYIHPSHFLLSLILKAHIIYYIHMDIQQNGLDVFYGAQILLKSSIGC